MLRQNVLISKHLNAGIRGNFNDIQLSIWLYETRKRSITGIAKVFHVHHSTISRLLRENGVPTLHNGKASGDKNWNWQGGKTKTLQFIRFTPEYKIWRVSVFERDNYTCVDCGQRGGLLEADHEKPQSLFPELRFVVANGKTRCKKCHRKTRTFGERVKRLSRIDFLD